MKTNTMIYRRALRQARRIKRSSNKKRSIRTLLATLKELLRKNV